MPVVRGKNIEVLFSASAIARRNLELAKEIAGRQRLQRPRGGRVVGPLQEGLAHMRHVEETGLFARPVMLGEDAGRILDRHRIAREGHHAGAERAMERRERRFEQGFG